jgi:hypothetical protein
LRDTGLEFWSAGTVTQIPHLGHLSAFHQDSLRGPSLYNSGCFKAQVIQDFRALQKRLKGFKVPRLKDAVTELNLRCPGSPSWAPQAFPL